MWISVPHCNPIFQERRETVWQLRLRPPDIIVHRRSENQTSKYLTPLSTVRIRNPTIRKPETFENRTFFDIQFSNGFSPFKTQPTFDHSKSGHVRLSDPHCIVVKVIVIRGWIFLTKFRVMKELGARMVWGICNFAVNLEPNLLLTPT